MKKFIRLTISIICVLTLFYTCHNNKVADFEIINESKSIIDSVKISCSGTNYRNKSVITKLLPKERSKLTLNMNDVKKLMVITLLKYSKKQKTQIRLLAIIVMVVLQIVSTSLLLKKIQYWSKNA